MIEGDLNRPAPLGPGLDIENEARRGVRPTPDDPWLLAGPSWNHRRRG